MKPIRKPDPIDVIRIVREEAEATGLPYDSILGRGGVGQVRIARHRAIKRILKETGCSQRGLSIVWGVAGRTIRDAARAELPSRTGPYDPGTIARLVWAHGSERAADIVAGNDLDTEADIVAWRRVCRGAAV